MSIQSILPAKDPSTNSQPIKKPVAHKMVLGMLAHPNGDFFLT